MCRKPRCGQTSSFARRATIRRLPVRLRTFPAQRTVLSSISVAGRGVVGLNPSADLGLLLQQRYKITIRASEAAARSALSRYEGEEIVTVETEQERKRVQQIAEARKKFLDGPVLILSLSPDVNYSFNPNNVIGIDASNSVYPTLRMVDNWGVLTVSDGAWLERGPTGHLVRARVPAPQDLSARPLKGEGWSLELANGWEVIPGERPGDVTIRKK